MGEPTAWCVGGCGSYTSQDEYSWMCEDCIAEIKRERDSLRAALESLASAWFAGVSGSPDRTEVSRYCVYCSGYMSFTIAVNTNETPFAHKPDCPIARARKLLEETNPDGK